MGTPKPMNLLVAGTNPVAVDAVTMRIMGLDPLASPPVWLAYMQGLGPVEPDKIRIVGPSVEELVSPFRQPEINLASGRDITIDGKVRLSWLRRIPPFRAQQTAKAGPAGFEPAPDGPAF